MSMRTRLLGSLVLVYSTCLAAAEDPPSVQGYGVKSPGSPTYGPEGELKPVSPNLLASFLKHEPTPTSGAQLSIQANQVLDERTNRIKIYWSITYEGPRFPFIILEPSLTRSTSGTTSLEFYAVGKSGNAYEMQFRSPPFVVPLSPNWPKDWFRVVEKGDPLAGHFYVVTDDLQRFFSKKVLDEFEPTKPPRLYVRMRHNPTHRGEPYGLDAWTGTLASPWVPVDLKEW